MMIYDNQTKMFAGKDATSTQILLLLDALVSGSVGISDPGKRAELNHDVSSLLFVVQGCSFPSLYFNMNFVRFLVRVVEDSLQPSKMLFDKESPNLYREPLISMQLTQRSLEQILSQPNLPASVHQKLASLQDECIKQAMEVQRLVQECRLSKTGHDPSPWGISGRKSIFEVLYHLASGSNLLATETTDGGTIETASNRYLDIIHNSSNVHPVVIEASQHHGKTHTGKLFLIE